LDDAFHDADGKPGFDFLLARDGPTAGRDQAYHTEWSFHAEGQGFLQDISRCVSRDLSEIRMAQLVALQNVPLSGQR
jgi:hypothetical protein